MLRSRKLLVASIGIASVSYVACSSGTTIAPNSGNLMAPPNDAAVDGSSSKDAALDAAPADAPVVDAPGDIWISSGNLMAPPGDAGGE